MAGPTLSVSAAPPADLASGDVKAVAVEPKTSPRAGGTYTGHGGRKVVALNTTSVQNGGPPSPDGAPQVQAGQPSPRQRRGKQTMEELDRRVAEDALALVNMKREIIESQRGEVTRAQQLLATLRKEHDTLHNLNELREREVNNIMDRARSLQTVDRGVKAAGNATQDFANAMVKQIAHSDDIQCAEQRTLNMQRLMLSRLEAEIADLRILSSKATYRLETLRHELVGTEATLIVSKQELGDREQQVHKMSQSIKGMRRERHSKLNMLQSIIDDGEHSLSRVQGSVFETIKVRAYFPLPLLGLWLGLGLGTIKVPTYFLLPQKTLLSHALLSTQSQSPKSRGSRGSRTGTRDGTMTARPEVLEEFEISENKPEIVAKRLTVSQVREMVDRYNSRGSRLEKLESLEAASRESVGYERQKRQALQEQLDSARDKMRALASSRQMYQEVEEKAKALAAARKMCDECREKDLRLKTNLESIRRAIPRFLSKITKSVVPVPTVENVSADIMGWHFI